MKILLTGDEGIQILYCIVNAYYLRLTLHIRSSYPDTLESPPYKHYKYKVISKNTRTNNKHSTLREEKYW